MSSRSSKKTISDEAVEVGRVEAAHGLRGEVSVEPYSEVEGRFGPGAEMMAVFPRSSVEAPRRLAVQSVRPHKKRLLVQFAGVADRDAAEELRGLVLSAEPLDDPDELWVHELVGRVVVDTDGTVRGTVTALEVNPASDLLVLDGGALVPLRFVVDRTAERLVVDAPEGLFDL